jgi:hypothetical protein
MATERRWQQLLLGALVVALVAILYKVWPSTPSAAPAPASNRQAASGAPRTQPEQQQSSESSGVRLEALDHERPKPAAEDRDLFRFKPKAPPPPPAVPPVQPPTPAAPVTGPPPPPPVPPITLKFIGTIEKAGQGQKIAMLSDGRGAPFYGKEGEVVEGRYRILRIGVESIEIAYADGRGRQTIRLTGQ